MIKLAHRFTKHDKRWKQNVKIHPVLLARFASNLKRERVARKLTHEAFAPMAGITVGYVSLLESASRTPSLEIVEACAGALKLDPSALLKETT